jgi:hypothetical protein
MRAEVDPRTGTVMNLVDLKKHMYTAIMDQLDHRNIDKDVSPFKEGVISSAENLVGTHTYALGLTPFPPRFAPDLCQSPGGAALAVRFPNPSCLERGQYLGILRPKSWLGKEPRS